LSRAGLVRFGWFWVLPAVVAAAGFALTAFHFAGGIGIVLIALVALSLVLAMVRLPGTLRAARVRRSNPNAIVERGFQVRSTWRDLAGLGVDNKANRMWREYVFIADGDGIRAVHDEFSPPHWSYNWTETEEPLASMLHSDGYRSSNAAPGLDFTIVRAEREHDLGVVLIGGTFFGNGTLSHSLLTGIAVQCAELRRNALARLGSL
jgi:hypothetical protein